MSVMIEGTEGDHTLPLFDGYSITIEWGDSRKEFDGRNQIIGQLIVVFVYMMKKEISG